LERASNTDVSWVAWGSSPPSALKVKVVLSCPKISISLHT
jgi:hypothetical protein